MKDLLKRKKCEERDCQVCRYPESQTHLICLHWQLCFRISDTDAPGSSDFEVPYIELGLETLLFHHLSNCLVFLVEGTDFASTLT